MKNRFFPYSYEKNGADGQPQIEVAFDSSGVIGMIFVYNQEVDAMVMVDAEVFETRHVSKYNFLQEKVNEAVVDIINANREGA